jgi:NAD-dependent SIR2 family protein deacetylase
MNMSDTRSIFRDSIDAIKRELDSANAILVGAGAGLSAAAGLLYTDFETFRTWFPGYHERYGLRYIYQAAFFDFPSIEEYYAYWARHITKIRYDFPVGKPYTDLRTILDGRNYFVLSTNADGQFEKVGFDTTRLCTPQGDYAFFQCSTPCRETIYPNRQIVSSMLSSIGEHEFAIRTEDIPRCPNCGEPLVPNLRKDSRFVEAPWLGRFDDFRAFVRDALSGRLLLLELGVGFNTPGIIRFPFEDMVSQRTNTAMIRINKDDPEVSLQSAGGLVGTYPLDAAAVLNAVATERAQSRLAGERFNYHERSTGYGRR